MKKTTGLGRGLSAILEAENYIDELPAVSRMEELDIELIIPNPKQPRTTFDDDALEELADSIATLGLIQPITVRRETDGKYIIISGERRWRASRLAGRKTIPAYVREADDKELHEMALVENIQRQDLNAMEIAISLQRLIDECGVTQETVAQRVGKKRSTIANYLRLMQLSPEVQAALKANLITMGHAKAIAGVEVEQQPQIVKKVIKKELSVRATEQLVKKLADKQAAEANTTEVADEFPEVYTKVVEQLSRLLCEDIKIKRSADGSGKIIVGFASDQEVAALADRLEQIVK
ncbi:MAG: ParB/RepB/Spo0J family partition protein [Rikenellaceae bacterium]|nr:ParB/RepB/Spo0J family partition protein [Rikenellaceae bacterium]